MKTSKVIEFLRHSFTVKEDIVVKMVVNIALMVMIKKQIPLHR